MTQIYLTLALLVDFVISLIVLYTAGMAISDKEEKDVKDFVKAMLAIILIVVFQYFFAGYILTTFS